MKITTYQNLPVMMGMLACQSQQYPDRPSLEALKETYEKTTGIDDRIELDRSGFADSAYYYVRLTLKRTRIQRNTC